MLGEKGWGTEAWGYRYQAIRMRSDVGAYRMVPPCIASKMTSLGRRQRVTGTKWIKLVQDTHIYRHTPERKAADEDVNTHGHEVEDGSTVSAAKGS
jgi:hypothetical protein